MNSAITVAIIGKSALMFDGGTLYAAEKSNTGVAYPEGYRRWTHAKSMGIREGHPLHAQFGGIQNACFSCHESEKKSDYVFGTWRK